jgi:hypothetical protein
MTDKDKDRIAEEAAKSQDQTTREKVENASAAHARVATPRTPAGADDEEARYTPAELLDLIGKAEKVEIGFTDDKGEEIEGLPRQQVLGGTESWLVTPVGLGLNASKFQVQGPGPQGQFLVHGPGPYGQPVYSIEGYALYVDGDEVAERKRDKPLAVEPGMTFDLRGDMLF